ncbi:GMC family oxidoreductase N-terminal domain-containing protein [Nocardia sp. NBC_00511]|uniref:GMC family oxidoreductase N-terminal domain-containing protein n=1 Tax=Nocardia sp. NBC_00511 TaxID=2903591 RepID=UPI0030DFA20B
MPLTFFETMRGELHDAAGHAHHVAVDLRCESGRALGFVTNGRSHLTGTIRAIPWADGAAVTGTLVALPVTKRLMRYELEFRDDEGRGWRLSGHKDVRWLRGAHASLTNLDATLYREGEEIAHGRMQFFANDYPSFLRSFQPWTSLRDDLADGSHPVSAFGAHQRATVRALAEALIVADGVVPPVDEGTVDRIESYVGHMTPLMQSGLKVAVRGLDAAARASHRKSFSALPTAERGAVLEAARHSATLRHAVDAVETPVRIAHFSDRRYLDAIGAPDYRSSLLEQQPGWMANVTTPDGLPGHDSVDCDVVVIGTGAGGAAVAARLTEQGLGVVMVEEGEYARRAQFQGDLGERTQKYWRDGGYNLAVGNSVLGISTGRLVGGTTAINSGTAFRTPDAVLREWLEAGFPSDFEPERFKPYLDEVEAELGITAADPRYLGRVAQIIGHGADVLGAAHGPLPRNAVGCDGQGQCVYGCPTDAKRSSNVSWVPRALKGGAQLFTNLTVTRILMSGGRATGVLAEGQDAHGAPRTLEVRARAVVAATGTLMTPLLLRRNGITLPALGRNLSVHPSLGAVALMPSAGAPWDQIPQGYHVRAPEDDLVTFEGVAIPPQFAAAVLPFHGARLSEWMNRWAHTEQFGAMVRDTGTGSVHHGPGGRTLVRYSVSPRVQSALQYACATLAELFLHGGAEQVALPIAGTPPIRTLDQARTVAEVSLSPRQFRMMGPHPLGTARMGADARGAVVDFEHRVFGTTGLYVVDGSVIPTSLGVNPQVTIMAFALRAADLIAADLG